MASDSTTTVLYYGVDLCAAAQNCMADKGWMDDERSFQIINARRLAQGVAVDWSDATLEAWEFELFLEY